MKRSGILVFVIAFAICTTSSAQEVAFKVLINKGKNELKAGSAWIPVKTGTSLRSTDEIKVADNAYIGLIHVSGVSFELKEAGKHKVADLSARVKGGTSVLNKYTDFILSSNEKKKNNLAATGAVTRGIPKVDVFLPANGILYSNNILLNWDKTFPGPYVVKLVSLFDDELASIETPDNFVRIDLNDKAYENEDNILVRVTPKNDGTKASDNFTLKRVSKSDQGRIKTALSEIASQTSEETALNKLVLAGFYEENSLFIDAATQYQEAIKLAPEVPEFKEAYNEFLLRNQIKDVPPKK